MMEKNKTIVAVTGASGAIYARLLLESLQKMKIPHDSVALVFSKTAEEVWKYELGGEGYKAFPFSRYSPDDFFAPVASGSAGYGRMIVIPCSMGTLGRIASGTSDDLIARAADVMLKEQEKLILVTREAPLNLIHIQNMERIARAGAIIYPASPSFYSRPKNIEDVLLTVVNRVLSLAGFDSPYFQWGVDNK
jgi:4-hydroxy-3-polyprenylbenzoate decarboxylase